MGPARDPRRGARSALRRRRRWLRSPRILRPTRAGWLFLAIILGVGFAALNTGNNLLYLVLSLMLAFLVLSGVLSESALRGIEVQRRLPREIFAEADNFVQLEVRNALRRVPAFAIVVEDRVGVDDIREGRLAVGRCFALRVGAGERAQRRYTLKPERRGELAFREFCVSTRFPFGLFLKSRILAARQNTLVYPAVEPLRVPPAIGAAPREGAAEARRSTHGAEVSGLRDFQPGDSLRYIHWRTTLRRGELVVREVEDARDTEVEVRLRTAVAEREAAEHFESRVSWAASEVVAHLRAGLRVGLRTDAHRIEADAGAPHRARVLAFLARVEPDLPDAGAHAA